VAARLRTCAVPAATTAVASVGVGPAPDLAATVNAGPGLVNARGAPAAVTASAAGHVTAKGRRDPAPGLGTEGGRRERTGRRMELMSRTNHQTKVTMLSWPRLLHLKITEMLMLNKKRNKQFIISYLLKLI
jgi:hypothetical protein